MNARALKFEDYALLAKKLDVRSAIAPELLRQVHRLLCDGHKVEDLTPSEQFYAAAFKDANCVQIPNDYGWEPGVEVAEKTEAKPPKKNGK